MWIIQKEVKKKIITLTCHPEIIISGILMHILSYICIYYIYKIILFVHPTFLTSHFVIKSM